MRKMKPLAENVHIAEDGTAIEIVDQTRLPGEYVLKKVGTAEEMYDAIKSLAVRGAPAIGIFAGYCMYALAEQIAAELVAAGGKDASATAGAAASAEENPAVREMLSALSEKAAYLKSSRPTAVNLAWATERMLDKARETAAQLAVLKDGGAADAGAAGGNAGDGTRAENTPAVMRIAESLGDEAILIQQEDIEMCRRISEYGLSLLRDGDTVLTHCNAGPLATSRYGTAIGPLILAAEQGRDIRAYADETRPLLQGARLTAYELQKAGVDVTLICDNMASLVMKSGKISACFVGCDRVAANGDTANKIGTSGVAILAKHYGIPFYVLGPTSSIDLACRTGADIPIELRDGEEIRSMYYEKPMAPAGVACFNPSFDVTDHELIAGIVTEKGIVRPPYTENLAALFLETPGDGVTIAALKQGKSRQSDSAGRRGDSAGRQSDS